MTESFRGIFRVGLLFLTAVAFSGCIQLSPQRVDFQPSLKTDQLIQGDGTASLIVEDRRQDKVIGYRGGVYKETSTIVPQRPLDQVIESLAVQVLERAGIELSSAFPDYDIGIQLDKLSYIVEDQKASIKRTTGSAAVSIRVKKGNTTFENGYSTTQYIETVGYPTEAKNDELLNNVFDAVLQRMFSDPDLDAFLN